MGKVVEKKKKKKKGRPSLLEIQKRNLILQQQQNQNQKTTRNPNPKSPIPTPPLNPNRRFTRQNPNPEPEEQNDEDDDDDDEDNSKGKRKEKKLNHVLRRVSSSNRKSSINSPYLDLGLYGSDSNEEDEVEEEEEEEEDDDENVDTTTTTTPIPILKKRKINTNAAVNDGSAVNVVKKAEKQNIAWKATEKHIDTPLVSGPTTPLPDKKLLVFILDRLQKKDTYGVYAEPVDPEELPDYHEIIENPMDFGTVRKKLEDGAYANLEQFENDVLLISSNAMQYNAPDTIYFRQARRIHELAKRDFENLRLDSDNEQRPKIVRRGRPPKNLQKQLVKTSLERDGLEATLTKGADGAAWSNSYNLRRPSNGSRNNEASWLPEHKFEKNDDFLGSSMKGFSAKYGKKHFIMDESRRNTYNNSLSSVVGSESSVLSTFDGETKQLLPVGLHTEHGYARSLARFAANLGPVAWRVASKKIERALPPGMKFGPGWVGDDEAQSVATASLCPLPHQQPFSLNQTLSSSVVPLTIESKGETLLKQGLPNISSFDGYPNRIAPATMASSSTIVCSTPEHAEASRSKDGGFGLMNNGSGGIRPPFQIHHPVLNPGLNGFSGGFGPNSSSQMGKLVRPGWSAGNLSSDTSVHSRILDMASKSNFIHSIPANHAELYNSKLPDSSSNINSGTFMPNSIHESQASIGVGQYAQQYWNGALVHQRPDSIPPDLNLRFQSPGSPSSSVRVDSPQPDLALQL